MVRVEERFMIQELFRSGVSISEIARRTGHDRKTVRSVVNGPLMPVVKTRPRRVRKIDPFVAYLERRIEQGVFNAEKLYQEIRSRKLVRYASLSSHGVLQDNRWRQCVSRRSRANKHRSTGPASGRLTTSGGNGACTPS